MQRFVLAKKKLIGLLEEEKQAVIHRAVTRGLDPDVPLKDSGIQWLGEMPVHWEAVRLKDVLSRPMRNGVFKKKDAFGSGVPLINVVDVYQENFEIDPTTLDRVQATQSEIRTYRIESGDIFFVRSSLKLEGTGRSTVAMHCDPDSLFECHLVQARPDRRQVISRFLTFQLNSYGLSQHLISCAKVVTMATVTQGTLTSCPVFLPSLPEQAAIVEYLDQASAKLDTTIDRAHREIKLFNEYRTRLIADVVTGKLDVREVAANLHDEDNDPEVPQGEDIIEQESHQELNG